MTDALPLLKATQASCMCPVCLDVFKDPVSFHCGHVLCRVCAVRCIAARPRCPLCNEPVSNLRHLLPLPQLSLFCILAREVGLRAPPPPNSAKAGANSARDAPNRFIRCTGTCPHVDGDATLRQQQRVCTALASPPSLPPAGLQRSATADYPDALLRSSACETQRMGSESPEGPSPAPSVDSPANLDPCFASAWTHPPLREEIGRVEQRENKGKANIPQLSAAAPFAVTETTTTSPLSPTLALLQSRFAEDEQQLESTPRLTAAATIAKDAEEGNQNRAEPCRPQTETARQPAGASAGPPSQWRLWKRGQGVVHCSLIPPAVRLHSAARAHQQQRKEAKTNSRDHEGDSGVPDKAHVTRRSSTQGDRFTATATTPPSSTTSAETTVAESLHPTEATRLHRSGRCVLCGLDVVQRSVVRRRLHSLLHSPFAQCDPAELAAQTEDGVSLLLGPLWGVRCAVDTRATPSASAPSSAAVYTSTEGTPWAAESVHSDADASDVGPPRRRATPTTLRAVAHHNCLAWAGLLDVYTDTALAVEDAAAAVPTTTTVLQLTVPLQDPFELYASHTSGRVARWQLLAATLWHRHHHPPPADSEGEVEGPAASVRDAAALPHCALCAATPKLARPASSPSSWGELFGVGLRTCAGTARGESSCGLQFHYPCALIAGAAACIVFGLEEADNVLRTADGACVCDAPRGEAGKEPPAVEVWCGPCHARHASRKRARPC
ncbi:hypothetical protein ABB37_07880 [Leptomonas pyrrhocoris]|uniref:RING-type domain-containing protein n=1 Tax=Leptomonas pyrrhocoris TaxID=157538 RepID=A0A0N0VDT6_LEPPY|nr:hypothetical protein ABB37_07880 [Leptomonas pyrrhocoris]KPA76108.1 hypothetical protein ABB37_07880 [Leptomonas pyrrhocoris]|eukprot:XP_015654547.1 hypothetical protein ABB37_07880 [Leptomonas pyrrhocoris]